jgi:exosome complex RNA-binding protein Rrp42 (RNase PH superfamily)
MTEKLDTFFDQLIDPLAHLRNKVSSGTRIDGRNTNEFRKVTISYVDRKGRQDIVFVSLGGTRLSCAIELQTGAPNALKPDCGVLGGSPYGITSDLLISFLQTSK